MADQESSPQLRNDLAAATKRVPLATLHFDPANARKHGDKNLDAIKGSLINFGQAEPLVVQANTGKVIGGNGRLEAMRALGWTHADVVELDITNTEAAAMGIALNRTAELAEWDRDALAGITHGLAADGFDLGAIGFDDSDLAAMLADPAGGKGDIEVEQDEIPEPPKVAVTQPGDLWELGDHRLICGDSGDKATVERLFGGKRGCLFSTDPPYGVDFAQAKF